MEAYEWTHFFTHSRGRHRYEYKFRHLEAIVPIVNVIVLFTIRIRKMLESTCYTEESSPRLMAAVSPIENVHMTIESKAILLHKQQIMSTITHNLYQCNSFVSFPHKDDTSYRSLLKLFTSLTIPITDANHLIPKHLIG